MLRLAVLFAMVAGGARGLQSTRGSRTSLAAGRMPGPQPAATSPELRAALSVSSRKLADGDERAAALELVPFVGELIATQFAALSGVDDLTREFALMVAEEFVEQASDLESRRRRLLKEVVTTALESKDPGVVDATLARLREEITDYSALLELVDEETAKLLETRERQQNQERALGEAAANAKSTETLLDFFLALRERLREEFGAAVYGEAARTVREALAGESSSDREFLMRAALAGDGDETARAILGVLESTTRQVAERPDAEAGLLEALSELRAVVEQYTTSP